VRGGVWTPGAAMGERLTARLVKHAGVTFTPNTHTAGK
jgi:short subunit dehydrogenase-like uncharacterized protein